LHKAHERTESTARLPLRRAGPAEARSVPLGHYRWSLRATRKRGRERAHADRWWPCLSPRPRPVSSSAAATSLACAPRRPRPPNPPPRPDAGRRARRVPPPPRRRRAGSRGAAPLAARREAVSRQGTDRPSPLVSLPSVPALMSSVRRRPVARLSMLLLLLLPATAADFQSACGCRLCRVYEWVRRTGCAAVAPVFGISDAWLVPSRMRNGPACFGLELGSECLLSESWFGFGLEIW
jgi:hypothetical protein